MCRVQTVRPFHPLRLFTQRWWCHGRKGGPCALLQSDTCCLSLSCSPSLPSPTDSSSNVTRRSRAGPASGAGAHPFALMVRPACPCGTVCVPASGGDGSHARGCGGVCLPLSAFAGSLSAGQGTRSVSLSCRVSPCRVLASLAPGACGLNRSFSRPVSAAAVAAAAPIMLLLSFSWTVGRWLTEFVLGPVRALCPVWPCSFLARYPAGRLGLFWPTRNSFTGRSPR